MSRILLVSLTTIAAAGISLVEGAYPTTNSPSQSTIQNQNQNWNKRNLPGDQNLNQKSGESYFRQDNANTQNPSYYQDQQNNTQNSNFQGNPEQSGGTNPQNMQNPYNKQNSTNPQQPYAGGKNSRKTRAVADAQESTNAVQQDRSGSNQNPSYYQNNANKNANKSSYYQDTPSDSQNSSYYQENPEKQGEANQQNSKNQFKQGNTDAHQPYSSGRSAYRQNNIADTQTEQTTETENKYPQDHGATEEDRQILAKIREKITGWFTDKYKDVSLNANNGVVTIIGVVKNPDDQQALVVEVRKIEGVKKVHNKTTVGDEQKNAYHGKVTSDADHPNDRGQTEADRELNAKIRSKITGWFKDHYKNITITTVNGVVTIDGVVNGAEDQKNLLIEVRKIEGVKNVVNKTAATDNPKNEYDAQVEKDSKYPNDQGDTESDRQLNAKIREKITGWFKDHYKHIFLHTSNGTVTVVGVVDTPDEQEDLVVKIRKIDGVKNVVNQTRANDKAHNNNHSYSNDKDSHENKHPSDQGETQADRELNEKIREKITGWFKDNYKNVSLNTAKGVVTVNGYVSSEGDINTLQDELNKVQGVRAVKINVRVNK